MDFTSEIKGDVAIVKIIVERADIRSAEKFKNLVGDIIQNGHKKIILDCSLIKFMDSTFLGALVVNLKRASMAGGDIRLVSCGCKDTMAWTLFETTRMFKVFQIFESQVDAIKSYEE